MRSFWIVIQIEEFETKDYYIKNPPEETQNKEDTMNIFQARKNS